MSDTLIIVAYYTRIVDHGDYYVIEFFDDRFIVRKNNIERDLAEIVKRIPCPYVRAFLRILRLRVRFDEDAVIRIVRCNE